MCHLQSEEFLNVYNFFIFSLPLLFNFFQTTSGVNQPNRSAYQTGSDHKKAATVALKNFFTFIVITKTMSKQPLKIFVVEKSVPSATIV